ncbi:hypothetical protein, conserved [Eimeria necatrix]|uniref:Uncharacterized protein n=1 Tax=Eimeria necatrix TaxID=51315 RepID=U6MIV8_9EIME|nr:hypothetical protein, conserved [Eimeria necatrix]CDJ63966.1 hypothetical protein, conserved [Eimeria necatrix]
MVRSGQHLQQGAWWQALPPGQPASQSAQLQPQPPVAPVAARNTPLTVPAGGLVQQRARVQPPQNGQVEGHTGSSTLTASASSGLWKVSNTGRAVQELQQHVGAVLQRSSAGSGWGGETVEVVVPVENLTSALTELSKFIQSVMAFCEAESMQKGMQGGFSPARLPASQYGSAGRFPVDAFVTQAREYAQRVTAQVLALRDLLDAVFAPSATRASVARAVQQFSGSVMDCREVYQLGSQVSSAAIGAMLPFLSTCSFFAKNGAHGALRLWSLVGARINSALRYLFQVLEIIRKTAGRLVDLVSGKIQPQSLLDFARSKPFFRAAAYMETSEARSVSAVAYFNDLAAAFHNHTTSLSSGDVAHASEESVTQHSGAGDDVQQSVDADEGNADFSLMAEDLSPEPTQHLDVGIGEDRREDLQTAADEESFPWNAPDKAVGPTALDEMQTLDYS